MAKVGVWEPKSSVRLDSGKLRNFVSLMADAGDSVAGLLTEEEIAGEAGLMKLDEGAWEVANNLTDEEIVALVRFFTLAEMQFTGWDGGKQSPVIYLVRILKERGTFTPDLRKWIKAHTDNRYLPYGSAL